MTELLAPATSLEEFLLARPLAGSTWTIAAVAIIALAIFLYRRERGLPIGLRVGLGATRVATLLLVLFTLCQPTASISETREQRRSLAVLVDNSRSMSIRDQRKRPEDLADAAYALSLDADELSTKDRNAIAAASRLDLAKSLPLGLPPELDLHLYSFGDSLTKIGERNALEPTADASSLAAALSATAGAHRNGSLAGIVLLSDGIATDAEQPETIAHDLGLRGVPLYILPTGIPDPDDLAIRNVIVQDVAFVGDTVPVRVQLRSRGYEKRSTDLVVHFNEREVARQTITLEGGLQSIDLAFDAHVDSKGAAALSIAIEALPDEATTENNRVDRSVRVVNEKINVLCIEGSARWEFRYLRAILKRDPRINARFIATRAGNDLALHASDYIARFPEDAEDAFKYDLVILGDVDSKFFTSGESARLEELVRERGGSLLMLAGPKYSPSSYAGTPVERMLPVHVDASAKWDEVGRSVHPTLTPEGRSSLVLTLENERAKNELAWSQVSPMDRLPPLLEPRPGAAVLATLSDSGARVGPYPLISWQRYGTGKCMLIATDRLWRLRFRTGDKYHWRVWSQCIQFLTLSRLMGEHKQIRMETDRASYPSGDQVRIYAEVLDEGYEPVLQERYDVYVGAVSEDEDSNKTRVSLRPDSTRPGLYVGYYTPLTLGRYRIEAGEDDLERANSIEFQVADFSPEMANTDAQIKLLQRMAKLSGGQCLRLAEAGKLAAAIDPAPSEITVQRQIPLWDNWLVAILLIGLMGLEWITRRRYDLL